MPARVVIVDDSAFVRRALERMLADTPEVRVIGTGTNGHEAVELVRQTAPDIVIMDVNMPEMNGLEALEQIMRERPTPVLLVSTLTKAGAEVTLQALDIGAVDFIDKGSIGTAMDIYDLAPLLRSKVLAIAQSGPRSKVSQTAEPVPVPTDAPQPGASTACEVIAIGASTGGPRALSTIVPGLPAHLGAGVVVAQHMPAGFTETLAERLDRRSALDVREAREGDAVVPGRVLIAPGRLNITLDREGSGLVVRVSHLPNDLLHQPSVDLLFESVAHTVGARAIGIVLTGMGDDGARGLRQLRDVGARTLVESPETAVIYGMPRVARPFAEQVLPLPRIAPALAELCTLRPQGMERNS